MRLRAGRLPKISFGCSIEFAKESLIASCIDFFSLIASRYFCVDKYPDSFEILENFKIAVNNSQFRRYCWTLEAQSEADAKLAIM